MNISDAKAKGIKVLSTPLDNIQQASELLDNVDTAIFDHLTPEDLKKASRALNAIMGRVEEIRSFVTAGGKREA